MTIRGRKNRRRIDQAAVRAAAASLGVRVAHAVGSFLLFLAAVAMVAYGSASAKTWLYTSRTFAIDKIHFEGLAHAEESELLKLSGLSVGDNIFQVDLLAAERAMASHPWARRVSLERELPRSVTVRVVEHQPAALADLGGLYYVNDAGKAFKKLAPGELADMPILRGVTREEYVASTEEIESLFREALTAIAAYRDSGLEKRAPLSELKVDRFDGLTAFCGKDAVAVRLGFEEYQAKFARLDRLFDELSRRGASAEVIRLDNRTRPGWVAVQLARGGGDER